MSELSQRAAGSKKGDWGSLAVLAGSTRYAGAAVLTVLGAARTGVDRIQLYSVERAADAALLACPEALTYPLDGHFYNDDHLGEMPEFKGQAVAIGPGITTQKATKKFFKKFLSEFDGPLVIDADGLRLLADIGPKSISGLDKVVLTPNQHELSLLSGEEATETSADTVRAVAEKWGAVVLCKGTTDYISDGTQDVTVTGGSSYLAKDGTGDVLTGVVGALLARGLQPMAAAKDAATLLKDAGKRATTDKGPALLASDVAAALDLRKL